MLPSALAPSPAPAPASQRVRARLVAAAEPFRANDNIAGFLRDGELAEIEAEVQAHLDGVLRSLVIDVESDHNTRETARRVARMFVREVFAGRYDPPPVLTGFPNVREAAGIYAVGPIAIRSACSHHLVPIMGEAWVAVVPGDHVVGLSKFARIAQWILARPQIQEEAGEMLADVLEDAIAPKGLALVIRARHLCCGWRGVKDAGQSMTTTVHRGVLSCPADRAEAMSIIRGMGF